MRCLIVSIPDLCSLSYFGNHFWSFSEWPFYTGFTVHNVVRHQQKMHSCVEATPNDKRFQKKFFFKVDLRGNEETACLQITHFFCSIKVCFPVKTLIKNSGSQIDLTRFRCAFIAYPFKQKS